MRQHDVERTARCLTRRLEFESLGVCPSVSVGLTEACPTTLSQRSATSARAHSFSAATLACARTHTKTDASSPHDAVALRHTEPTPRKASIGHWRIGQRIDRWRRASAQHKPEATRRRTDSHELKASWSVDNRFWSVFFFFSSINTVSTRSQKSVEFLRSRFADRINVPNNNNNNK